MDINTKDRRRQERVTVWSPIRLETEDGPVEATLRNLSLAGVCCTARSDYAEMTRLKVSIELPLDPQDPKERLQLDVEGVVVRCRPQRRGSARRRFELAIYFPDLKQKDRDMLETFVRCRSQDPEVVAPD